MPTHGSLTKAGKVRAQTPRVEKTTQNGKTSPKLKNRSKFKKMQYLQKSNYRDRRRRR
jgi:small subunit ribosomal protein S30e